MKIAWYLPFKVGIFWDKNLRKVAKFLDLILIKFALDLQI